MWNWCGSGAALVQTNPSGADLRYDAADTLGGIRCRFGPRLSHQWQRCRTVHGRGLRDRTEGVVDCSCRLICQRRSQCFSAGSYFWPQRGHFHIFEGSYPRPVFLLLSLGFIKTMSGELLCPSVDDKQQESDLKIYLFFEYQIKMQLLQLFKRSKDVKMQITSAAPSRCF